MLRSMFVILGFITVGCGSYLHVSTVQRSPEGGIIAVDRNPRSREAAERRMSEHCAGRYALLDEQRVVVGQKTTPNPETEELVTEDIYEFQLSYRCLDD
ncbi:MAG: hypothetical protein ACN4G0_09925 [Polyangiales bacterium]